MRNTLNEVGTGIPCEKCGEASDTQRHKEIGIQQKRQPFYYSKWFYCRNKECSRTIFMDDQFKVFNSNERGRYLKNQEELEDRLDFFHTL